MPSASSESCSKRRLFARTVAVVVLVLLALFAIRLSYMTIARWGKVQADEQSRAYLDSASESSITVAPVPPLVPALYRLLGTEEERIASVQRELVFWSWIAFAACLFTSLRSSSARLVAVTSCWLCLLSPARIGWTRWMGPESVVESLALLAAALAVLYAARDLGRYRKVVLGAIVLILVALLFADDLVPWLIALGLGARRWWLGRPENEAFRPDSRQKVLELALLACAIIAVVGATVDREPSGGRISTQASLNLVHLAITEPESRDDLEEAGLPPYLELRSRARESHPGSVDRPGSYLYAVRVAGDEFGWPDSPIATYVLWLVANPVERLEELVDDFFPILSSSRLGHYDLDWTQTAGITHPAASSTILLLLLIALPVFLRGMGPLRPLGSLLLLVGAAGLIASYFCDPIQPARSCYPYAQLLIVAIVLTAVFWLDGCLRSAREREAAQS